MFNEKISDNNEIICLNNISKDYFSKSNTVHALKDFSLEIKKGDFIAIMGESGAGKTTLLNLLGLIDKPTKGKYILYNKDTSKLNDEEKAEIRNKVFGFIVQDYGLIDYYTVFENVEIPLLYSKNKLSKEEKEESIKNLLTELGIEDKIHTACNELSGGQKQRVAIARALINTPEIILADEPTGSLDEETSLEIFNIFKKINKEKNITLIIVTHNSEIASFSDKIIRI